MAKRMIKTEGGWVELDKVQNETPCKSKLLVTPELLCAALRLPPGTEVVGAEVREGGGFDAPVLALWLDGDAVPDAGGGDITATYRTEVRPMRTTVDPVFQRFEVIGTDGTKPGDKDGGS